MRRIAVCSTEPLPARAPLASPKPDRFLSEDLTTSEAVVVLEAIAQHLDGRLDKVKMPHQSRRLSHIAERLRARARQIENSAT